MALPRGACLLGLWGLLLAGLVSLSASAAMLEVNLTPLPDGAVVNLSTEGPLDWVHWGLAAPLDLNRHSGITPVIPNIAVIGTAPVEFTNGLAAGFTWTNGTPTLEASNVTGFVFARGLSNGFALALAADTQPRRLRVYLGAIAAQGRFEASLSDSSAPSYTDNSLDSGIEVLNGYYTLDFAAGTTGQTLRVTFTMSADPVPALASVFLQAATLSSAPPNLPPIVALTCPTNLANFQQSAPILVCAEATDPDGSIALVEFFDGRTKIGEAPAGPFAVLWTNASLGAHTLTAAATDGLGARRVSAPVTVFIYSGLGLLTVTGAAPPTAINLTAEGLNDWAHWGLESEYSFNHKAGVSQQISNFTLAAFGPAYAYADNTESYSWTDGTPTVSVSNVPAGVYVAGLGEGFEVRVAADTTVKTLMLYVGAYGARGRLQAWLDDFSAPVFFDQSLINPGNGPGIVYTMQFRAGEPGRTLVLRYTVAEMIDFEFGNVTLQAATLVGANLPPTVSLTTPTNNTVLLAPATITLRAEASDSDGSVAKVEFFNGATWLGEVAGSPYEFHWSNVPLGSYFVTARVTDDQDATFTTPPAILHVIRGGGFLAGQGAAPPARVNLSEEGPLDWGHWGLFSRNSFNHKAGGPEISNVVILAGTPKRYADNATGFSWTNGMPTQAANPTTTGIFVSGLNGGFQWSLPADRTLRRLRLYVGLYGARGRFEASLSDFSAAPFWDGTLESAFGNAYRVYTIHYAAASPGQSLAIRWTASTLFDEHYGNVTWQAATLMTGLSLSNPRREASGFSFTLGSEAGFSYMVESSESLRPGSWTPLTNFIGIGGEMHFTDPGPLPPHRAYRLRLP
ncbi:MAG TPA: Ig-like domain-containing protein [Verrucomicrobiae bacterium]|nr:Ig-like domain-containing protein [Verrucomicrobiae bacterium]